jgi:prepilin-type N-terminal cleavage/methylation domain-containing protein
MIGAMRRRLKCTRNNRGFTLIEIAIVLILIGIILGAIVKGKDIVKSGEQKKLYTAFINEWNLAFNSYYDRTGWILADDNTPTNVTRNGQCSDATTEANIEAQLAAVGLEPPNPGTSGNTTERGYKDSNGVLHTLALVFDYDAGIGNFIRLTGTGGIPNDLGLALDRIVDGVADGTVGDLQYTADHTVGAIAVAAWPAANSALVANAAIIFKLSF